MIKTILITGVTRGLGRALAERFIALGHTVLGCGRSRDAVAELRGRYAAPHDFEAIDVADDSQVQVWANRLLHSHGAPDLLLNNAALMNRCAPLWEVTAEEVGSGGDVNMK